MLATTGRQLTFDAGQANVFTLPVQTEGLPAGTDTPLVRTTDPTSLPTTTATGPTLVVEPPVVTLSAAVGAVSPAAPKAGRRASALTTLLNTGDIDSTAPLTISLGLSTDGTTVVTVPITTLTQRPHVKAKGGPAKLRVSFTVPTGLATTPYFLVVTVAGTVTTPATNTVSAVGQPFTPFG